jgi:VWFA-related protein
MRAAFVLTIILLGIPVSLAAATGEGRGLSNPQEQTPSAGTPGQPLVFKSRAILVQVPVVVTDKTGKHVHDLRKNDFRLLQNKQEQKIAVFDEITATAGRPVSVSNPLGRFSNVNTGTDRRYALTLIVLDGINTGLIDQSYGRMELIKYLSENPDNGPPFALMLMNPSGVKSLVSMTDERRFLISALKKLNNEIPALADFDPGMQAHREAFGRPMTFLERNSGISEGVFSQDVAIDQTMHALLSIAWSLSGFPGRKSLIWATGGFPFYLDSASASLENARLSLLYQRAMEALNDAQVSVYPLDVRGLVSQASISPITNRQAFGTRNVTDLSSEAARRGC